jgi:hypothetical protein
MKKSVLIALAAIAVAPAAAMAQWSDNFDSYGPGTINGQGGWQGWDNVPAAAGTVTAAVARSSPNSQLIQNGSDSVQRFNINAGQWSFRAWQFIPQNYTGDTYVILNNQYNDGGPWSWAVQMLFQGSTGLVLDDNGRTENSISFVRGAWAEVRVDFDLTTNTIAEYYNGALLSTGTWAAGGPVGLAALDLYSAGGTAVYYDDLSVSRVPAPSSVALLGLGGLLVGRRRR